MVNCQMPVQVLLVTVFTVSYNYVPYQICGQTLGHVHRLIGVVRTLHLEPTLDHGIERVIHLNPGVWSNTCTMHQQRRFIPVCLLND